MSFADSAPFFSAAATAAASLIGLLFVAVSIQPQSIFGTNAGTVGRSIAVSAFVALANAFFISLAALLGQIAFAIAVICLAAFGLLSLWRLSRVQAQAANNRWMAALSVLAYVAQLIAGSLILGLGALEGPLLVVALTTLFAFAIALVRAWLLLQGRHTQEMSTTSSAPN